jgi:hypothetical protein
VIKAVRLPSFPEPHDVEYNEKSTEGVVVIVNGVDMVQPEASITERRC